MRVRSLGQEDSPGEGNDNPLQYCCLRNSMNSGAWGATYDPRGGKEWDTTEYARTTQQLAPRTGWKGRPVCWARGPRDLGGRWAS